MFRDRAEAGRQLAASLAHLRNEGPVVLALPRGGVAVGYEVAKALDAPLDLVLVRKIGAPGYPEYGIGAVCDGPDPITVVDERAVKLLGVPPAYLHRQEREQLAEIERRRRLWMGARTPLEVTGRTAIVVDDGIATGGTMRAALQSLRRRQPRRLVLAVPVAAPDSLEGLRQEADEMVCLLTPPWFGGVGAFYQDFHQLAEEEVGDLLHRAASFAPGRDRRPGGEGLAP